MKKRLLALLFIPLLLAGCNSDNSKYESKTIETSHHIGEIGDFDLLTPVNGFSTDKGFTFTWEEASNADYYQLELANTPTFINDEDEVYVKESNISLAKFDLNYTLPKKDILYYWRVTAVNKDHTKKCGEIGNFYYKSSAVGELPIEIEDAQDWVLHKEGSYADISIDRNDFFGNGENSLVIQFDKEHTLQGVPKSDGWIVVTKTEDRELYGTDAFYFNFYYSGHDSTVLIRVLDYDGEYWHQQVQISNNAKQTILMKYEDFTLKTAGTNIFNRKFDWEHIRYFEIVFERTFGDGICILSDIKAVKYSDYKHMFMEKMDFRWTDPKDWTYENFDFDKTISEDGSELTLTYLAKNAENNPDGFAGYGFQSVNLFKYFATGDALRMKVKYTGASESSTFFFRVTEEDLDRWQYKLPFSYLTAGQYKEIIIPLKAFQRMEYMQGDGAKQFYFIPRFSFGLSNNYSSGTLSIKDLEVIKIDDIVESRKRVVGENGCIENFNDYELYTEIYYYWEQSSVNKDEAMKLDTIHKAGDNTNTYCAEFDYKADMEMATYQIYLDTKAVKGKTALSLWLKDATPKPDDKMFEYLKDEEVAGEMTIQLTMDSGEWYRYVIPAVKKEWHRYTIAFEDFELFNEDDLFDEPNDLACDHIIHMAFGFKYNFYDEEGNHVPTYAIANPVYLDEIYFTSATKTSVVEIESTIKEDAEDANTITVDTMEKYDVSEDIFVYWSYGYEKEYNSMTLSNDVSSQGGTHSLKMHYMGNDSVSYGRTTQFASTVTAKGIHIDIKGDGKATIFINLNWRSGSTLYKMRYSITTVPDEWKHYELGFTNFLDINGSNKKITMNYAKYIESISFGIINDDKTESDIYIDNLKLVKNIEYSTNNVTAITNEQEVWI